MVTRLLVMFLLITYDNPVGYSADTDNKVIPSYIIQIFFQFLTYSLQFT